MKLKNKDIDKAKKILNLVLVVLFIVVVLIFVFNYGFTDWEAVSDEFSQSVKDLVEGFDCEIDYKDFHYRGVCLNQKEIFSFLNNVSGVPE